MPFIQNVARSDVQKGNHKILKGQSAWIQLTDPDCVSTLLMKETHDRRTSIIYSKF
jgi:uncharacterized protein YecT (DUF1311 family)